MKLDLRQLRYVLALDRHRNFARAAEEIGLTQPALSRSLQSLEDAVGARLFDRDRSRVEPTAVGARLIELARPLLTQVRLAERELERTVGSADGLLRIGAGPYASEISVGTAVGRMVRRHPGIRADVSVSDWPELYRRLLADELDVVVAETSHAGDDDRLLVEPLPAHRGVFYCRTGHPLAGRSRLTRQDIAAFPLAIPFVPRRLLELLGKTGPASAAGMPEGVTAPELRVETPYLARRIVMESDVLGVAAPVQIEREIALGLLCQLPLELPELETSYGILRLARRTLPPVAAEFLQVLREVEGQIHAGDALAEPSKRAPTPSRHRGRKDEGSPRIRRK
jgi:DNA-binding transcriptional LysR family regulator